MIEATRPFGDSEYGYHWVIGPQGEFYALGLFGQVVAVLPKHDAVVVMTSAIGGPDPCSGHLLPLLHRHSAAIFLGTAADGKAADSRLALQIATMGEMEALVSLARPRPELRGVHSYAILDNQLGVERITLNLSFEDCALSTTDTSGVHSIMVGIDRWIEGMADMPGAQLHHGYALNPAQVLAGARWLDADRLEMTWIFAETAFRDTVDLRFMGNECLISRSVNVNSGATIMPQLKGKLIGT